MIGDIFTSFLGPWKSGTWRNLTSVLIKAWEESACALKGLSYLGHGGGIDVGCGSGKSVPFADRLWLCWKLFVSHEPLSVVTLAVLSHTWHHPCTAGLARCAGRTTPQSPEGASHSWQEGSSSCSGLAPSFLFCRV